MNLIFKILFYSCSHARSISLYIHTIVSQLIHVTANLKIAGWKDTHRVRLRLDIMEIVKAIAITNPMIATVLTTRDMNL